MAASLQSLFSGLSLRGQSVAGNRKSHSFVSNGNAQKVAMKAKHTFQVEVSLPPSLLSAGGAGVDGPSFALLSR